MDPLPVEEARLWVCPGCRARLKVAVSAEAAAPSPARGWTTRCARTRGPSTQRALSSRQTRPHGQTPTPPSTSGQLDLTSAGPPPPSPPAVAGCPHPGLLGHPGRGRPPSVARARPQEPLRPCVSAESLQSCLIVWDTMGCTLETPSDGGKPPHQKTSPNPRDESVPSGAGRGVACRGRHPPTVRGGRRAHRRPRVSSKGPGPGADPRTVQGPPDHADGRGPWLKGGLWGRGAVERPRPRAPVREAHQPPRTARVL